MTDDEFDSLVTTLQKMSDLQLYTIHKVTQLQAQVLVLQSMLKAQAINAGGASDEVERQCAEHFARVETMMLDGLKNWLSLRGMALPPKDDSWWDRPSSSD